MKKVYFALSIRGEEMEKAIYSILLEKIKAKYEVVNEQTVVMAIEGRYEQLSDEAIYERDIAWIAESDMIIAECSKASLGVGYELAYGEYLRKPVYVLYQESYCGKLSAMINGNNYFKKVTYDKTKICDEKIEILITKANNKRD